MPQRCRAADLDKELAEASHSPEAVSGFIETHTAFSLGALWHALGMPLTVTFPDCEEVWAWQMCSAELLSVADPAQIIVLIRHENPSVEMYLHYVQRPGASGSREWLFSGYFESAAKYFPLRHRIVMFGGKPFLAVVGQGASGTGVSSEYEKWIDLGGQSFTPVFSYTVEAQYSGVVEGYVSRHIRGSIVALKKSPGESITVAYHADFTYQADGQGALNLGSREDTVVFVPQQSGDFALAPTLSTISEAEFEELYGARGDAVSCDDLVKYDFQHLREMLSGGVDDRADKLRVAQYLGSWCADSTEVRELRELAR